MAYSLPILLTVSRRARAMFMALGALAWLASSGSAMTPDALVLRLQQASPPVLIDLRATHDFQIAHIPGALNIPFDTLARRQLPPFKEVVLIGDGRGAIDVATAAATLAAKTGAVADVLEGGFAAWENSQRVSTRKSGFNNESLPMATFDQVVGGEEEIVLVDLRTSSATVPLGAGKKTRLQKTGGLEDPLDRFARRLPRARRAGDPFAPAGKGKKERTTVSAPEPAGSAGAREGGLSPLLVLIDNNDGRAQEVARRLIAQGNRRFVILAGGAEALQLEGKPLVERTGGSINVGGAAQ